MPSKRYSTEQIVSKLRQAEVELSRGLRVPLVWKKLGISEQTYYRWRKEYGGLGPPPAGGVGAAGLSRAGPGAVHAPASRAGAG